jgi:hypothetical protein
VGRLALRSGWARCSGSADRRDREDELDLADIGGETGTATHSASVTGPGRRPKRISVSPPPAVTLIPPLDPAHDEIDAAGPSFPRIALSVCIPG